MVRFTLSYLKVVCMNDGYRYLLKAVTHTCHDYNIIIYFVLMIINVDFYEMYGTTIY